MVQPMAETMRVTIRGVTYDSVREAASELGVAKSTVYCALSKGNIDTVGLGPGTRPPDRYRSGKGKEITLAGVTFPSIAAASVALGFRAKYLALALSKGKTETRQRIAYAALRYTARRDMDAVRLEWRAQMALGPQHAEAEAWAAE